MLLRMPVKWLLLLMLMMMTGSIVASSDNFIVTPYSYECTTLNYTAFTKISVEDFEIFVQTIGGESLQQVVSRIFAILMRQVFQFSAVQLMQSNDGPNSTLSEEDRVDDMRRQLLSKLTDCSLNKCAVINLGVQHPVGYPLTDRNVNIHYLGPLGPTTRYGWFLPKGQTLADRQTLLLSKFTTEHFQGIAQHFMTVEEINNALQVSADRFDHYQPESCKNGTSTCAVMLAGSHAETAFIAEHIRRLRINVQVLWLGDTLVAGLRDLVAKANGRLFLILARTPSEVILDPTDYNSVALWPLLNGPLDKMQASVYDLTPMSKFSCNSDVRDIVDKMHFDGQEAGLLRNVRQRMLNADGHQTVTEIYDRVACDWLSEANEDFGSVLAMKEWSRIVRNSDRNVRYIQTMFPPGELYAGWKESAQMAVEDIQRVMPNDVVIGLAAVNGSDTNTFLDIVRNSSTLGFLGTRLDGILCLKTLLGFPVIDCAIDTSINPNISRMNGDRKNYTQVYSALFRTFGWRRVALLTDQPHLQIMSELGDSLKSEAIHVESWTIQANASSVQLNQTLGSVRDQNFRIIITDLPADLTDRVLCAAHLSRMTARENHVWFLPAQIGLLQRSAAQTDCSAVQLAQAFDGHMALYSAPFADNAAVMRNEQTVGSWRREFERRTNVSVTDERPTYVGFVYDAVWSFAMALNSTLFRDQLKSKLNDAALQEVDMEGGASGHVRLNGSRALNVHVGQQLGEDWRLLYKYVVDQSGGSKPGHLRRVLNSSETLWPLATGPITDGTVRCHMHGPAEWLGWSCATTIITAYSLLAAVCVAATLAGMYAFWERRYTLRLKREAQMLRSFGIDLVSKQVDESRLDKSELPRHRITLNRRLGGGQFGTVYYGQYRDEQDRNEQVAVKTPENANNFNARLEFLSEAQAMRRFEHPNIVRLIGVSLLADPMYIVMEYMLHGDLNMYLLARRDEVTTATHARWSRRLTGFALDLARGLAYMAAQRYVHRDIACRNCLLSGRGDQLIAKLADFGMSRPVYGDDVYKFRRRGALPVRWSAPESMSSGMYSPATDVWSFGVLLWEMVTLGAYPYHEVHDDQVLLAMVRSGRTLTIPPQANDDLRWLMSQCWHLDAGLRLRACEIVDFVSSRDTVVEPCVADGEQFAQIYEMNNEPNGGRRKGQSEQRMGQQQHQQQPFGEDDGEGKFASVQTLRNDLASNGPSNVLNNGNEMVAHVPLDVERPLLKPQQMKPLKEGVRRRPLSGWAKWLRFWRVRADDR